MGIKAIERKILAEAKIVTSNNKLKMKDITEWSTGQIELMTGEKTYRLPKLSINIAVKN